MNQSTRCQHIVCRVRQDRQDLQCNRLAHGPETRHYHSLALGYCNERFAKLVGPGSGGRSGGHANPIV
jgi:hypothetical protein